ncbi:MAG TPA: chemotaxis protein CheW [Gemmatimonadales bacterium]|nr:chemotaxis protein CheW [Gemmatimonadales bacterium]
MTARFLVVHAAGRAVGLPVEHLEAVTSPGDVVPVPSQEPALRGVVTLRGAVLPVVHLGALMDGGRCPDGQAGAAVVVTVAAQRFCLEVDDAEVVQSGELLPLPRERALPWAGALVRRGEELLPLLDLAALAARLNETGRL